MAGVQSFTRLVAIGVVNDERGAVPIPQLDRVFLQDLIVNFGVDWIKESSAPGHIGIIIPPVVSHFLAGFKHCQMYLPVVISRQHSNERLDMA